MKLHIGCGNKFLKDFVHIDIMDFPHVDIKTSADDLNMIEDNSVELIYVCHLLEHFGRHEVKKVLKEWYRVLKPGGKLRIAVPDFEAIVEHYLKNRNMVEILGLLSGGQKNEFDYHKILFDENFLKNVLKEAGFNVINRYNWKETEHSQLDDFSQAHLPHMDKENGMLMSLNVEAIK